MRWMRQGSFGWTSAALGGLGLLVLAAWTPLHPDLDSLSGRGPDAGRRLDDERRVTALRADLEEILRAATGSWRSSRWGVLAVSLDRGDTLFQANPADALAPASNLKLLTTAAALHQLGPAFRYQTFLLASGPLAGGRLEGDLILYGTGDPGISDRFQRSARSVFEAFADSLTALGIQVIEGDVVGDGSYFTGPLLGEGWNPVDLNDHFAAPSGALSYNENVFSLRVRGSGAAGTPAQILTLPNGAGVPIVNEARVGSGSVTILRTHPSLPILVRGSLAGNGREVWRQMTVPDPAHFAASVLRTVLEERGVRVLGGVRATHDPGRSEVTGRTLWAPALDPSPAPRVLARHLSPPLIAYLDVVNKRSHNLLSDQVLKTLGRIVEGEGSFEGGARAARRFLAGSVGLDTSRVAIYDGSGLSALNRVSASDFVGLMAYMAGNGHWDAFWETLPEAGDRQGLRRMYRSAAAGNLRAKTGTIQNVSALSGVVRAVSGERIAFSILANQVTSTSAAKGIEDRIGTRLASFERPPAAPEPELRVAEADVPAPPHRPDPDDPLTRALADTGRAAAAVVAGVVAGAEPAAPGQHAAPGQPPASAAGATAPAEGADRPAEGVRRHQVDSGENFTTIARRYGLPVDALVEANPTLSPRRLQIGAWVEIPPPPR